MASGHTKKRTPASEIATVRSIAPWPVQRDEVADSYRIQDDVFP